MKTIWMTRNFCVALAALATICFAPYAGATTGDFYPSYLQAKVIAHLPLSGGVQQMFLQQDGRKQYLYVQENSQQGFTVIDTTRADRPRVVDHVPRETLAGVGSGLAIAETPDGSAAGKSQVAEKRAGVRAQGHSAPELVRVLDISDPAHPRTAQTFDHVTSILQDRARNLVYIANANGIWVVSHRQVLRRHGCSSSDEMSPMPNCN